MSSPLALCAWKITTPEVTRAPPLRTASPGYPQRYHFLGSPSTRSSKDRFNLDDPPRAAPEKTVSPSARFVRSLPASKTSSSKLTYKHQALLEAARA